MSKSAPTSTSGKTAAAKAPASPAASPAGNGKPTAMPDVQASSDARRVAIDKVGVKDITYPMRLRMPPGRTLRMGETDAAAKPPSGNAETQTTVATINMYVSLPHYQKGTHMSRFLEVLNENNGTGGGAITPEEIPAITRSIRERLNAADAHFEAHFTYFISKKAPVTGAPGIMDYKVSFECSSHEQNGVLCDDLLMSVSAPAASLCPCSKEISKYGAHNQRCHIGAKVRFNTGEGTTLWIEDLAEHLENSASVPVYAVLKRPDEKYVTEAAYENPKFVEDIIRDLAISLDNDPRITWYSITSENFESIHNHNAYAQITRDKRS